MSLGYRILVDTSHLLELIESLILTAYDANKYDARMQLINQSELVRILTEQSKNLARSKKKNVDNLYQEYENEKYSVEKLDFHNISVNQNSSFWNIYPNDDSRILVRFFNNHYLMSIRLAKQLYVEIMSLIILNTVQDKVTLIDLGAGDGRTLIPLLLNCREIINETIAVDLSPSGIGKIKHLAESYDLKIRGVVGNILDNKVLSELQSENSLIFTSFSLICLPNISNNFLQAICDLNPKYVMHFEPNFQAHNSRDLIDRLTQNYFLLNDYNVDYFNLLDNFLKGHEPQFQITQKIENIYGQNSLLPASYVCWQPKLN